MNRRPRLVLIAALAWAAAAVAAETPESLVSQAESARAEAVEARAELLAPESFRSGERDMERARSDAARGRNADRVSRWARDAILSFRRAAEAAELATTRLAAVIRARTAASEAGADDLKLDDWRRGEDTLEKAAIALERGDEADSTRLGESAADLYRSAELRAIKLRLLADTKALIEDARKQKVQRYAPRTLARAEALISEAAAAIEADRYDTDKPRELALEARYEVRHAFQIARRLDQWRAQDQTPEDLILEMEEPLSRVASEIGATARFDEGPGKTAEQIIEHLDSLANSKEELAQALDERTRQVFALEQEISDAQVRLGGVSEQRQALEKQLQQQEIERQRLDELERMFQRDEARVLRQGGQVVLRLYGLAFAPGSAQIPARSSDLMKRMETAVRMFPDAEVTVTGHTDSFGSDQANFELSRRRAEAVRAYLIDSARLPAFRVSAVGYGETQPVASNQTADGRARNRRIDVFIKPAD
jgi:OOP family OmpA-OmpF porin